MPYQSLPVVRAVRQVLHTAASPDEAVTRVLEAVGDSMGWLVGAFWLPDGPDGAMVARSVWAARIHKRTGFAEETQRLRLPAGHGLPGRVWTSEETVWVEDVGVEPDFMRAEPARTEGLHAAVAFPVRDGAQMVGVLEFFTDVLRAPVQTLLPVFDQIGAEVGQFMAGNLVIEPDGETDGEAEPAGN